LQYFTAKEQVKMHEEFDKYLASGKLDDDITEFGPLQVQILPREI
jgi:hypothetical protein